MSEIVQGKQNRFVVQTLIARGGMGEVFLGAREDGPDAPVAIKMPLPGLSDDERALFPREADAASRVDSPYVIKIIDWGENPPFIALEYVAGGNLDQKIAQRKRGGAGYWSLPELLNFFEQLVAGMKAVNAHVTHRDLKPLNIFVDGDILKIADFGLAKYVGELTRSRTLKGWGSAPYMAPESFKLESVTWKADQYSLGVVFYEMAALKAPFEGTWEELEAAHLYSRPELLSRVVPNLPERLAGMVGRMLEKEQEARFPNWDAVSTEIRAIREREVASEIPPDPLVSKAAAALDAVRVAELKQQQEEDEKRRRIVQRGRIVEYWATQFRSTMKARVDNINARLGRVAVGFESPPMFDKTWRIAFLRAVLEIQVDPIQSGDCVAWGFYILTTPRQIIGGNLLLLAVPEPYGSWRKVRISVNPLLGGGGRPRDEDREGGRYKALPDGRSLVAMNASAMLFQWKMRQVAGYFQYEESSVVFEDLFGQLLTSLVEDGGK